MPSVSNTQAKRLLPTVALGGIYFFYFAGVGALFPILPVILERRGLSPTEVGWVFALIPLSSLLIPPIWGALADAWHIRPVLIRVAAAGAAISVLPLAQSMPLGGTIVTVGFICCFRSAIPSLTDASTYALLATQGEGHDYGRIRMWGSVGFAIAVTVAGELSLAAHPHHLATVTAAAFLCACLAAFALPNTYYQRHAGVLRGIFAHVGPKTWVLLGTVLYYAAHGSYDAFFSLHLESLGHSDRVIGVAWGTGVATEIALMRMAPRLVRRFSPEARLTTCAVIATGRWLLIGSSSSGPAIIATQPLHALTFGLWYISLVDAIHTRAPEQVRSTLQASANMSMGAGMLLGFLGGGPLFQHLGGAHLFRVAACCAAGSGVAYIAAWYYAARRDGVHTHLRAEE